MSVMADLPVPPILSAMLTVRAALAPLHGEPRVSSSMTSQLFAGTAVEVLDAQGDWRRVRGADGYDGWMHQGYLTASSGGERTWRLSLGCTVRDAVGRTVALPLGARVAPTAEVTGGDVIDADARTARFPARGDAIVATAQRWFSGASYLWGGVSPWGCDCSGLVQTAFALHGVPLPRDAWQQALVEGTAVANLTAAQAGTLLFFTDRDDRRITHVGIATGNGAMLHSALTRGGVALDVMTSEDPYVARLRAGFVSALLPTLLTAES